MQITINNKDQDKMYSVYGRNNLRLEDNYLLFPTE